jgi:alpha-glucosidase (family GH31 glycosyl hydrolase)
LAAVSAILVSITSEPWTASFRIDEEAEAPPFLVGVPGRCFGVATGVPPEPDPSAGGWLDHDPPLAGWRHGPRDVAVAVEPAGEGVAAVTVTAVRSGEPVVAVGARFAAAPGERFWGFGERSHALDLRGTTVEHRVGEGPYQLHEYGLVEAITPHWAVRRRRDATYYPIPWLLSSRGYGVLVDNAEVSLHRLAVAEAGEWSVEVRAAELRLRVFAGPRPADALRRFTAATGRQPPPAAAWFYGPWFQTGHANQVPLEREREIVDRLRGAGAPASAAETHMRRLPAGAHVGRRDGERARTAMFHAAGLACLTYFNPMVAEEYEPVFARAAAEGMLQRRPSGEVAAFTAYAGGRVPPIAFEAQLDFTAPRTAGLVAELVAEALEDGVDGWMEDFGEYTPPDAVSADGTPAERMHNLYPVTYHRAFAQAAAAASRPLARFARSGWTGAAPFAPIVWGGDPTTGWGFDGLRSALTQALGMGLSGVAIWGSDIGGFFSLGAERLTPELLVRWIQFGAVSTVMRTKAEGVAIPEDERPQIWDPEILPHWRRWASLHTQLNPYLQAAAAEYVETGMPVMRHLALMFPDDPVAAGVEDQFLLGPDLLAAPVLEPGARERRVYLPAGPWVDLWRSAAWEPETRALVPGRPRVLDGPAWTTLPAPLEELPLLVRAGARIPMLPPRVLTLTSDHLPPIRHLAFV